MSSTDPTAVIILSEIIALETIIIIAYVAFIFLKKKKTIKHLKEGITSYNEKIPDRKSSLNKKYSNACNLQENDINELVGVIVDNETKFLHAAIDAINGGGPANIHALTEEMYTLVSPYEKFSNANTPQPEDSSDADAEIPDIDSAIDDLLADEADDAEGDPSLDLSDPSEKNNTIDEIPDELLSENHDANTTTEAPNDSDKISDDQSSEDSADIRS